VPYLTDHFPQKSLIISGSFAQNVLQLKAPYESSPPCTHIACASQSHFLLRTQALAFSRSSWVFVIDLYFSRGKCKIHLDHAPRFLASVFSRARKLFLFSLVLRFQVFFSLGECKIHMDQVRFFFPPFSLGFLGSFFLSWRAHLYISVAVCVQCVAVCVQYVCSVLQMCCSVGAPTRVVFSFSRGHAGSFFLSPVISSFFLSLMGRETPT